MSMALLRLNAENRLSRRSATGEKDVWKDVLLLIDISRSMKGEKLEQAKEGAIDFARTAYRRGFATALAVFGTDAEMICGATVDAAIFERKIRTLTIDGSTNLAAGLKLAGSVSHLNAVVVVTDGEPDSQEEALVAAESLKKKDISILCIGTDDADKSFLAKLATETDLAIHVDSNKLGTSIGNAIRLLPGTGH